MKSTLKDPIFFFAVSFCLVMGTTLCQSQNVESGNTVYIKAGKLYDSENEKILANYIIKVEGNKISEVGKDIFIPKNARVIDLSTYTVMPGLIDGHTHLMSLETLSNPQYVTDQILFDGDATRVLRGASRAKSFLDNGVTTVRDLGDSGPFLDVALRNSINEGTTVGPRMFVSGPIISPEGGQVPGLLKSKRELIANDYTIVRSVDDAINAVREHVTYGADIIKICANNTPNVTSLTIAEMKAIVTMAHRYKRKVTAHATNDLAVWEATTAGVDAIEHGYQISDSTLSLMAKKGVALVPTDISKTLFYKYMELSKFKDIAPVYENYTSGMKDRLQRAIKAKVTILAGSDNYINFEMPQGEAAKNILRAYLEEGMAPLQILRSSTYLSAKFMNMGDKIGVVKKGAFADIVAVKGDVEKDFSNAMFNMVFVMKDGQVHLDKH
jgi:imidazolonepropionase-like amidohydrolase